MVASGSTELERVAEEQAALRRVATLVAEGTTEDELAAAVTAEIGRLAAAQRAATMRCEGDTFRAVGVWSSDGDDNVKVGQVFPLRGDTIVARVAETCSPARLDGIGDLTTEFARARWVEFGLQAGIGAPVIVGGSVWGVVTAFRTRPDDPFPPGIERRLGDFAALVAQAIVNAETRREAAALVAEQSALRRIATLVAGGKPQAEVLDAVTSEAALLFGATSVELVRSEGEKDEVVVVRAWCHANEVQVEAGSLRHPSPGGATLQVLETGVASRSEESSAERGLRAAIAAPVIVQGSLLGGLIASRDAAEPFPPGAEIRLRSFADLAAQSIANERAQNELRASRARLVRTADEARRRLERNLHDGAQQRLVSASLTLRLATGQLFDAPREDVHALLVEASTELTHALEELRDLARGLHPAILTERGLEPALTALAQRAPLPVEVQADLDERLPPEVEAAVYYVVAESLTNVAKYAQASEVTVRLSTDGGVTRIEVVDDGVGGAELGTGSGLLGLADRVEALGGNLCIESPAGAGTRVWATIPSAAPAA